MSRGPGAIAAPKGTYKSPSITRTTISACFRLRNLGKSREMTNHPDSRATQLYDRRTDVAFIGEYLKVEI
jgi:hypothetical protein